MSELSLRVDVDISREDFLREALQEVCRLTNQALTAIEMPVRNQLRPLVEQLLAESPEGLSMQGGRLQAEVGVPLPAKAMAAMAHAIVNAMVWVVEPCRVTGQQMKGALRIGLLSAGLHELIDLPEGEYVTAKSKVIPWLDWVLVQGTVDLVRGWEFRPGHFANSRTGLGIMVRNDESNWHVPAEFAGTERDNWAVRALQALPGPLERLVEQELRARLET